MKYISAIISMIPSQHNFNNIMGRLHFFFFFLPFWEWEYLSYLLLFIKNLRKCNQIIVKKPTHLKILKHTVNDTNPSCSETSEVCLDFNVSSVNHLLKYINIYIFFV